MIASLATLTRAIVDGLRPAELGPDDERAFVEQCRGQTVAQTRALTVVFSIGILGWWPLDRIIFKSAPDVLAVLGRWRIEDALLMLCLYLALTLSSTLRRHVWAAFTFACIVAAGLVGGQLAGVHPPSYPFLQNAYLIAPISFAYIGPLRPRALLGALMLLSWGIATRLSWPGLDLAVPLGHLLGLTLFSLVASIVLGHAFYLLRRQNFAQQRALDRRAVELEVLLTEQRRMSETLEVLNADLGARVASQTDELRELTTHLGDAMEAERGRVARDLHDELGQVTVAMRMEVAHLQTRTSNVPVAIEGLPDGLARLHALLDRTLASVQHILTRLQPRLLEEAGLSVAVETLVEEFRTRSGLTVALQIEPADLVAERDRSIVIYRALQECLTNVVRHSAARSVTIALRCEPTAIRLSVRDDGGGFDVASPRKGRMGLFGMRERARQFGGRVDVESALGRGTIVELLVPIAGD